MHPYSPSQHRRDEADDGGQAKALSMRDIFDTVEAKQLGARHRGRGEKSNDLLAILCFIRPARHETTQ